MSLTLTEAKAHVRDCIERDDVAGMQKLMEDPEPFVNAEAMRGLVDRVTNAWPKLQAQAAKQREFERLRKLDEPSERELEKLYSNRK